LVKIRYSSGFGASIAWFLFNLVDLGTSSTGTRGFVGRRQDFLQANGQTSIALARLLRTRGLLRSSGHDNRLTLFGTPYLPMPLLNCCEARGLVDERTSRMPFPLSWGVVRG